MNRQEQLIDKYLRGEIKENDLAEFEKLLVQDEVFAAQVASQISLRKAARKEQIAVFETMNAEPPSSGSNAFERKWLLLALGFLLLILAGLLRSNLFVKLDPTEKPNFETPKINKEKPRSSPMNGGDKKINIPQAQIETPPEELKKETAISNDRNPLSKEEQRVRVVLSDTESIAMLEQLRRRERRSLTTAGDRDWQSAFLNNDMAIARELLDIEIEENLSTVLKIQYYFAGMFHLYAKNGNIDKAIDYLVKASNYRSDTQLHLVIAYVKNNQFENANIMLSANSKWEDELPESIKAMLTN